MFLPAGRVAVLAAAVMLSAASGAPPAGLGIPVQGVPGQPFRTAANYVRVDVYATSGGAPVLDLGRNDFTIAEDGVPQPIDAFERVLIRASAPTAGRRPETVAESRAQVAASRARLFVLFLDVNHVEVEASRTIRQPLVNALGQLIGPDDLVAVMTPEMSAADISFDRLTGSIESLLMRHWDWGERARSQARTPREQSFQACYPGLGPTPNCTDDDRGVADEMIDRFREEETLQTLDDLIDRLRDMRDERKAVLVISDGWRLFRPNPSLARRVNCRVPMTINPIDPISGRLTVKPREPATGADLTTCEADRMAAAALDDDSMFRTLVDRANRSNVSFYTVDPRGLAVFDTPLDQPRTGREAPQKPVIPSLNEDAARLRARQDSLRNMAVSTDGLAVLNSNDIESGLTRIAADLSSYYLLSYYSTGKLDGKFHAINVRVTRPGVNVRARRGYLAATAADVRSASATPSRTPAAQAPPAAFAAAVSSIAASAREMRLKVAAASAWPDGRTPRWWVAGEVSAEEMWRGGGQMIATISTPAGETIATGRTTIAAGVRSFRLTLSGPPSLGPGEYSLQVRAQPAQTGSPSELASAAAVLASVPGTAGAVISRGSASTGNRDSPAVDVRFRRSERLRADVVDVPATAVTSRLLDRNGSPLQVPVGVTPVSDDDGVRWQSAQLVMAPLAPGDYVIEIVRRATDGSGAPDTTLVPFRVLP